MNQTTKCKSALTILIEEMKKELKYHNENDAVTMLLVATIRKADSLLTHEKFTITQAFYSGFFDCHNMNQHKENGFLNSSDYYEKIHL